MIRAFVAFLITAALAGPGAVPVQAQGPQQPGQEPVDPQSGQEPVERTMEGLTGSVIGPLDDSAMEARATRLAAELRCPVCQGLSIDDSPSPLAQQMKDLIRARVVEGWSDEEIHQYFMSKYGEWVLMEPKAEGLNLLVYLLPALALVGGGGLIAVAVRRWTEPVEDGADDDDLTRDDDRA
ncbi:MAG: cytochrome c-type biogenesis protein [Gemmatimonadota bacterium]